MADEQDPLDKLNALAEQINDKPGFGLMAQLGIDNHGNPLNQGISGQPSRVETPAADNSERESKMLQEVLAPLNSSFQGFKQEIKQDIGGIRTELSSIRQTAAQPQTTQQDTGDVDPIQREVHQLKDQLYRQQVDTAWQKAQTALSEIKAKNPDTELDEDYLRQTWQSNNLSQNVQIAQNTNWRKLLEDQHAIRQAPKIAKENETLKAQMESAKSNRNVLSELGAVPRNSRGASQPDGATGSGDYGTDNDVYKAASAQMGKGKFMGFGKALFDAQRSKSLRSVS
jgi:hypothetical protein